VSGWLRRWEATITYRTDDGQVDVTHDLEEIADLHELVERGPHWDTIERIVVVRVNHVTSVDLTIDRAEEL
jgi:hypothetical protein